VNLTQRSVGKNWSADLAADRLIATPHPAETRNPRTLGPRIRQ
jgi:hypothetical protein